MERYDSETRGTVALVLGILGFVGFGLLTGIPAWIIGNQVMAQQPPSHPQYGYAQVGRILGIISVVLGVIGVVFGFLFAMGLYAMAVTSM